VLTGQDRPPSDDAGTGSPVAPRAARRIDRKRRSRRRLALAASALGPLAVLLLVLAGPVTSGTDDVTLARNWTRYLGWRHGDRQVTLRAPSAPTSAAPVTHPGTTVPALSSAPSGPGGATTSTSTSTSMSTSALTTSSTSGTSTTATVTAAPSTTTATASSRSVATTTTRAPSTTSAPAGNPSGWKQVFRDDFAGSSLGSGWGDPYDDANRKASHVSVGGGVLTIAGYQDGGRWVGGGVSNWPLTRTYGKWEVRFRIDKHDELSYTLLLWPDQGWPPEIDFAEDAGGDRSTTSATLHYGPNNSQIQKQRSADFSQWHTLGVEWTAGKLVYTLDGAAWATVTGSQVPSQPMWLGMQMDNGGCSRGYVKCPLVGTPARSVMQVDWVAVYAPA